MINRIRESINRVFIGKEEITDKVLICLLSGGHILIEDVPGVGKTTLAKTLADVIECSFGRIQFTPDTLPGDVAGTTIYNMKSGDFEYREGAVMKQIVLADEINRTSPRTQSSLLEAMEEAQVTVDGTVHRLPDPFMVIATQNPIDFVGTYPLPEAQMDRFMMRISIGYPSDENEIRMTELYLKGSKSVKAEAVCSTSDIIDMRKEVSEITVNRNVLMYSHNIINLTRSESRFRLGASPRAMLALTRASQARAFLCRRDYVMPDDVRYVVNDVLLHRLILTSEAKMRGEDPEGILHALVLKAKIPV
jgi:MoxR-like ATPase